MKKRFCLYICVALFAFVLTACSNLQMGDTFTTTYQGVEYNCEVIVSRMNYVRINPVSSPAQLSGTVVVPPSVKYEGDKFIVTQIAKEAFRGYTGITEVILPLTLSAIEEGAFQGCTALKTINTPQPLSTIGDNAFDGCVMLESFSLEASISALGSGCFRNCASLGTVTFPSSFSEIPAEAFYGCTSLENLTLSSTIMRIGDGAFAHCEGLKRISMDRSVMSIGDGAFSGCTAVEAITCLTATPPVCFSSTFTGIPTDIPVTVPMPHIIAYQTAVGWNQFSNFQGVY